MTPRDGELFEAALEPEMPKEMDSSSSEGETQKRNMKIKSQVSDDAGIAAKLAYDAFFSDSDSGPMPRRIMEEVLKREILKELNWSSSEGENDDYTIHGRSMTTPPPPKQGRKLKSLEAPVSPPCHNARKRRRSEQKDEIKRWLEGIDDGKEKQVSTVTEAKAHSIGAFLHSFITSNVVVAFFLRKSLFLVCVLSRRLILILFDFLHILCVPLKYRICWKTRQDFFRVCHRE